MPRKAKLTVLTDRLEMISGCPCDILDRLEPSDEDFENIEKAEHGDTVAISTLAQKLYGIYGEECYSNAALFYFLIKGVSAKDEISAKLLIRCIERFNEHFDLLDEAIGIVNDGELCDIIKRAKLKSVVASVNSESDFAALRKQISETPSPLRQHALIYLFAKEGYYTEKNNRAEIECLAEDVGMSSVTELPIMGGENAVHTSLTGKETEALLNALSLLDMDEWRDFWLAAIYEHATLQLLGDLSAVANDMIQAIEARVDYERKPLHLLAIKKYLYERGLSYSDDAYHELELKCRFDGLGTADEVETLIKEAVYTSGADERKLRQSRKKLGTEIVHERNRYSLTMTLTDHQKRAAKHQWKSTVSIESKDGELPVIAPLPITQIRAEVMRNGIILEKEKKTAQVLCSGNLVIGEKISPFEIDLILDISYVSTTKCTHCDIKIERHKRVGNYIIMQTVISIY